MLGHDLGDRSAETPVDGVVLESDHASRCTLHRGSDGRVGEWLECGDVEVVDRNTLGGERSYGSDCLFGADSRGNHGEVVIGDGGVTAQHASAIQLERLGEEAGEVSTQHA